MQDFGLRLHFYAFIFPFLLFSASYMHVHTSARLLTYMRVRVSASVPELFLFFGQKILKNFCPQWGFGLWHGISRGARSYIGFASYIALRQLYLPLASDIALFVRSCGESGFLSFRHCVPPPSSDGGFFRREQAHRPTFELYWLRQLYCLTAVIFAFGK